MRHMICTSKSELTLVILFQLAPSPVIRSHNHAHTWITLTPVKLVIVCTAIDLKRSGQPESYKCRAAQLTLIPEIETDGRSPDKR